ncbi:hypothetical protein V5O48_006841 [Marasmius crinis-equi]|uniref:Trypsin-like serine protease n=1 Tax=Marasmius crinis-equi TaxID=585013 RepID=A0ABR3FIV1_9AGAR
MFRATIRPSLLAIKRPYATVSPSFVNKIGTPPPPPPSPHNVAPRSPLSQLDRLILQSLRRTNLPQFTLFDLISQYISNSGKVLNTTLLYESRPGAKRKVPIDSEEDVVLIANCISDESTGEQKVTVSSGFALEVPKHSEGESVVATCAHTLEEIRRTPLLLKHQQALPKERSADVLSGMFVITGTSSPTFHPIRSISSALPRSDILLLTCDKLPVRTLPVSPYPAHPQTPIRVHLTAHDRPPIGQASHEEWKQGVGGTWRCWGRGEVKGYRDFAGREAQPGTYDALSHMQFHPLPTAGSSGGPIVDEESGAVVGMALGTRMDNRVEGTRGWGVPSECIFEMFSLPGLEGKM